MKGKTKKGNYKQIWKFIKESRNYFYLVLGLFIVSILIGYIFPVFFSDFIKKFIEEIVKKTEGLKNWQLFIFILQNNLQTAFLGLIFGILFGILPLILILFNGYVLGFVANKTVAIAGSGVLIRLLPHGIFEIPAIILSFGLGLRLGMFIFKKSGQRKKEFMYSFGNSMKTFLYVIIPLLIIAALIETWLIVILK